MQCSVSVDSRNISDWLHPSVHVLNCTCCLYYTSEEQSSYLFPLTIAGVLSASNPDNDWCVTGLNVGSSHLRDTGETGAPSTYPGHQGAPGGHWTQSLVM